MLTRKEQARLGELCWIHGIEGETEGERYGRLVWTLLDISGETDGERFGKLALRLPTKRRGRPPTWNKARLLLFLDLVEQRMDWTWRRFSEVKRTERIKGEDVESDGWHMVRPRPWPQEKVEVAVLDLMNDIPEVFGDLSVDLLIKKVSEARALRRRLRTKQNSGNS